MRESRVIDFEPEYDNRQYDLFPKQDKPGLYENNNTYSRSTVVDTDESGEPQDVFPLNQMRTNLFTQPGNAHLNVNKSHVVEAGVSRDTSLGANPRELRGNNTCVEKNKDSPLTIPSATVNSKQTSIHPKTLLIQ